LHRSLQSTKAQEHLLTRQTHASSPSDLLVEIPWGRSHCISFAVLFSSVTKTKARKQVSDFEPPIKGRLSLWL
jgi:hypothetical protein